MQDTDAVKLINGMDCLGFHIEARVPKVVELFRSTAGWEREIIVERLLSQAANDPDFHELFGQGRECICPAEHDGPLTPEHVLQAFLDRMDGGAHVVEIRVMRHLTREEVAMRNPGALPALDAHNGQGCALDSNEIMLHVTNLGPQQVTDRIIGACINLVGNAVRECFTSSGVRVYDPDTDAGRMAWDAMHLAVVAQERDLTVNDITGGN